MLEDRYYMRGSPFDSRRSVTLTLVFINVAAFLLQLVLSRFTDFRVLSYLALSLNGLKHGYAWQIVTYAFLHAGWLHLLFNCWAIYVFGQSVEEAIGRKSLLALYLSSAIIGGLVQALAGATLGHYFAAPVVGASAAAFGLVAAYAMLFPDRLLLLFFIIPVRAKYLLVLSAALAIWGIVFPTDNIAHAAHLGGMLAGIGFIRYALQWNFHWPQLRIRPGRSPHRLVKVGTGASGLWGRGKIPADEELPPEEFLSKEVDPILDKISAHGIQSLTARERRILEAARQKMGKR